MPNITWAYNQLKAGRDVRRTAWADGYHTHIVKGQFEIRNADNEYISDWTCHPTDFDGDDWEAVVIDGGKTSPITTNDFNWAMLNMRAGEKVTRLGWKYNQYICIASIDGDIFTRVGYHPGNSLEKIALSVDDVTADDWIIFYPLQIKE